MEFDFELPDDSYSMSDNQDYIEYIIKKTWSINNNSSCSCLHQ